MDHAEQLWDIEQIKQLKARYYRYLDTRQWQSFRSLFTDDAKMWMGLAGRTDSPTPSHDSPEAFVEWIKTGYDRDRPVTVHHGHMPEIEILSAQTARGIWAMFDWVDRPNLKAAQGYGHYYEEYEKGLDSQWRIKTMRLTRLRRDEMPTELDSNPRYGHVPRSWPR